MLTTIIQSVGPLVVAHGDGMGWFGHQVMNAVIHSVIYGMVLQVFKTLGVGGSVVAGLLTLAAAFLLHRFFQDRL